MKAHAGNRSANLVMIKVRVVADKILDLRNADAVSAAGIDLNIQSSTESECFT